MGIGRSGLGGAVPAAIAGSQLSVAGDVAGRGHDARGTAARGPVRPAGGSGVGGGAGSGPIGRVGRGIPAGRRVTGRRGPAASASAAGRRPAGLAREGLKPARRGDRRRAGRARGARRGRRPGGSVGPARSSGIESNGGPGADLRLGGRRGAVAGEVGRGRGRVGPRAGRPRNGGRRPRRAGRPGVGGGSARVRSGGTVGTGRVAPGGPGWSGKLIANTLLVWTNRPRRIKLCFPFRQRPFNDFSPHAHAAL